MKMTEKATAILVPIMIAMPWICTYCLSVNLKEFSSKMSRINSLNWLTGIGGSDPYCISF